MQAELQVPRPIAASGTMALSSIGPGYENTAFLHLVLQLEMKASLRRYRHGPCW